MKKFIVDLCAGSGEKVAKELIAKGADKVAVLSCGCGFYGDSKRVLKFLLEHPINSFIFNGSDCINNEDYENQVQEALHRVDRNNVTIIIRDTRGEFYCESNGKSIIEKRLTAIGFERYNRVIEGGD